MTLYPDELGREYHHMETGLVYDVENQFAERMDEWHYEHPFLDYLESPPAEAEQFIRTALDSSDFGGTRPPGLAFDVRDDDWRMGWWSEQVIHLHHRLASRKLVLHELAHHLVQWDSHGPTWRWTYAHLIQSLYGNEPANLLRELYAETGLTVQELPVHLRAVFRGKQ